MAFAHCTCRLLRASNSQAQFVEMIFEWAFLLFICLRFRKIFWFCFVINLFKKNVISRNISRCKLFYQYFLLTYLNIQDHFGHGVLRRLVPCLQCIGLAYLVLHGQNYPVYLLQIMMVKKNSSWNNSALYHVWMVNLVKSSPWSLAYSLLYGLEEVHDL